MAEIRISEVTLNDSRTMLKAMFTLDIAGCTIRHCVLFVNKDQIPSVSGPKQPQASDAKTEYLGLVEIPRILLPHVRDLAARAYEYACSSGVSKGPVLLPERVSTIVLPASVDVRLSPDRIDMRNDDGKPHKASVLGYVRVTIATSDDNRWVFRRCPVSHGERGGLIISAPVKTWQKDDGTLAEYPAVDFPANIETALQRFAEDPDFINRFLAEELGSIEEYDHSMKADTLPF